MVRSSDYLYGIVHDRGEYGFDRQPQLLDDPILSRVQSLAASFQWIDDRLEEPVAIAVDQTTPALLIKFTKDLGDPNGRLSMRMHVWICHDEHELPELLQANWPDDSSLPITSDQFLKAIQQETGRRFIVGPAEQFTAVEFEQTWGGRSGEKHSAANRPVGGVRRNARTQRAIASASSEKASPLLRAAAAVLFVALLCVCTFAWNQFLEIESLGADLKSIFDANSDGPAALQKEVDRLENRIKDSGPESDSQSFR